MSRRARTPLRDTGLGLVLGLALVAPALFAGVEGTGVGTTVGGSGGGGISSPIAGDFAVSGKWSWATAGGANALELGETAGRLTFEGATADAFESRLGATDPTVGDQVFLLPDMAAAATYTIVVAGGPLGTPSSGTLTNATGLPLGGITGFGSGVATLLGGASSGTGGPAGTISPTFTGTVVTSALSTTNGVLTIGSGQGAFWPNGAAMHLGLFSLTTGNALYPYSQLTPDSTVLATGSTSNSWHIAEAADALNSSYDFNNGACGAVACTDPSLIIHSHNQSTTQYFQTRHNGTIAILSSLQGFAYEGTVPAVSNTTANSCGTTTATIVGTDNVGEVTVGATAGTSCTLTFNGTAPVKRVCSCQDQTSPSQTCQALALTTTTSKLVGTFAASDVLSYECTSF